MPVGWPSPKVALGGALSLRGVLAILALASLSGLALASLSGCGSSSKPRSVHLRSRANIESIFEDEALLRRNPAAALAQFKALGVDRVRVYVPWSSIAPASSARVAPRFTAVDPAAYPTAAWSVYDQIVKEAHARGIGLDFTLGGPVPLWAEGAGEPGHGVVGVWKPKASEFGAFVQAVGTRYGGSYKPAGAAAPLPRVSFWSIWNEPNYGQDLAPQAIDQSTVEVSTRLYRNLLDAAWQALKATGHGHDTILFGETAPRGITTGNSPGNFSGMVPLRFLRALYCVDAGFQRLRGVAASVRGCPPATAGSAGFIHQHPALFQATGFAAHLYPQGALAPDLRSPDEPDYADLASLGTLERTLDRLQATYGSSRRLPIFSTEFGYQTDPPEPLRPSPVLAAAYLNQAEYMSWGDPRVRSYDQFLMLDPPGGNFATGLEFTNGKPKATYDAFRMPLYLPVAAARSGEPIEIWGCVRPAPSAQRQTGRPSRVRIEFAAGPAGPAGSGGAFKAVRSITITDPHGYVDVQQKFDRGGRVRLAWSYPGGPEIHSRVVAITVH